MSPLSTPRFFDGRARSYDAAHNEATPAGHALRMRLHAVIDLLEGARGDVLDAGMGPGRLCEELARRDWRVFGVDASAEMVALACDRLPEARDRFLQGRLEGLPFEDETFDAVVATGVLEYLDDRAAAVSELCRVLRPGGRAVMSIPNVHSPYVAWRRGVFYPAIRLRSRILPFGAQPPVRRRRPPTAKAFAAMLVSADLAPESLRHVNYFLPPSPLDEMFPNVTRRLAERLEGSGPRMGAILATQLVFAARKGG